MSKCTLAVITFLFSLLLQLQRISPAKAAFALSSPPFRPPAFASPYSDRPKNRHFTILSVRGRTNGDTAAADDEDDDDDFYNDEDDDMIDPVVLPRGMMDDVLTKEELDTLTVPQLKQQLRLRGFKVSGRKQDLIDRLLASSSPSSPSFTTQGSSSGSSSDASEDYSKARTLANEHGKELIDVTEYLDDEDRGKEVKTWTSKKDVVDADFEKEDSADDESSSDNKAEVWGSEARIVDDYEGRRVVIDSLTQSVVEFKGSNQSYVSAFVVASRDALKPFLAGGGLGQNQTAAEQRLKEIQTQREKAHKRPVRFEDDEGIDEGDETGLYANAMERDYSDWGEYTLTGAQLSAQEVQGVLLLSDVYGAFTDDTKALAEKIAFECQPVVVMVPDLFRGEPWQEESSTPGKNAKGQTYEQWRATHDDLRVSIDTRAAAACLRERYGVSSVVVWGTCYGGGRALEAAAGYLPEGRIHDYDGNVGPPLVNPLACIAWYPTRYNAAALFGKNHVGNENNAEGDKRQFAVMGVFAERDEIPGATPDDASQLKVLLGEDSRVKDYLVKVFPGQDHGFAHRNMGKEDDGNDYFGRFVEEEFGGSVPRMDDGDADVACLLSTAFMETYSRVFLPTTGAGSIKEEKSEWSSDLNMPDISEANKRDIRAEIEDALDTYKAPPLGGTYIDPTDPESREKMEQYLRSLQTGEEAGPYKIQDGDDLEMMFAKLKAQDENFQLF